MEVGVYDPHGVKTAAAPACRSWQSKRGWCSVSKPFRSQPAGTLIRQRQMTIAGSSPGRRPEDRSAGRNPGRIP